MWSDGSPALCPPGWDLAFQELFEPTPLSVRRPLPGQLGGCKGIGVGASRARGMHKAIASLSLSTAVKGPVEAKMRGSTAPSSRARAGVRGALLGSVPWSRSAGWAAKRGRDGRGTQEAQPWGPLRAAQQGRAGEVLIHLPLSPVGQRAPQVSVRPCPAGTHMCAQWAGSPRPGRKRVAVEEVAVGWTLRSERSPQE